MEEIKSKNKFFITHVTNATKQNLVFLINNKPTGIKAGETKNLRKEVKLKCYIGYILHPSEDWLVRIIDSQTGRRFLHINITQKLLDDQTSEVIVDLLDVTRMQIIGTYIESWWQAYIPNDESYRFNIQLILKGKERLEDSELDVLAEGKFLGYK